MKAENFAIMAVDMNYGVGYKNQLPWPKMKEDLKHFKDVTMGSIILMGRKTWESIGSKRLPGRINVVISSNPVEGADWTVSGDLKSIFEMLNDQYPTVHVYLIGGAALVEEAANKNLLEGIILSMIELECECDVHLNPEILSNYSTFTVENVDSNPKMRIAHYWKRENLEKFYGSI